MKKTQIDAAACGLAVSVLVIFLIATFQWFDGATVPFLAFALAGGTLIQAVFRARLAEVLASVGAGALLAAGYVRAHGQLPTDSLSWVPAILGFVGLGSIVVTGGKAVMSADCLKQFLLAIFCPVLAIVTNIALAVLIQFQPVVFDHHLLVFDGSLGFQASAIAGSILAAHPLLKSACWLVYGGLPLASVLVFALYTKNELKGPNPLQTFVLAGVLGCLFYQVLPAAGPSHVFPFPGLPQSASLEPVTLPFVPRNAIPSLHIAWALLICVALWSTVLRWFSAAFLGLTVLATLGFGEHYLIDLIVAVPFTLAVLTLCSRRWGFAAAYLGVVSGWLLLLRFCQPVTPAQAWLAIAATAFSCWPGFAGYGKSEDTEKSKVFSFTNSQADPLGAGRQA